MTFSRLMLVTQSALMRPNFSNALEAALAAGARLVQLREKDVSSSQLRELALHTKTLCDRYGAQLVVNGAVEIARETGAGVHLQESQSAAAARAELGKQCLIGQSVHSVASALRAQAEGCDYVVFGSVFATATHPGGVPAGLEALEEATRLTSLPVLAIGGLTPENAAMCRERGAHGVAVIRAVWEAQDTAVAVRRFLAAVGE